MAPPSYIDLGKAARDVFNAGYVFDMLKLNLKTKQNIEFKADSSHLVLDKDNVESKYVITNSKCIFTLVKKLNPNYVKIKASISGLLYGVKLTADGTYDSKKETKVVRVKYKNDYVSLNLDAEFKSLKPVVNADAVVAYNGWLGGFNVKYNTNDKSLQSKNLTLSYIAKQFAFTCTVNDNKLLVGSVFRQLSDQLDFGLEGSWSFENRDCSFAVGTQYQLNNDVKLRAKINNKSQLGLGCGYKIKDVVTLTFSGKIECRQFNQGGHKFGIGLELDL